MENPERLHKLSLVVAQSHMNLSSISKRLDAFLSGRSLKNGLYILMEVVFYLLFAILVILAIMIPTNPLEFSAEISQNARVNGGVNIKEIEAVMIVVKLLVILISLGFLFAAIFSRKARKRGYLIAETQKTIKGVLGQMEGNRESWS